MLTGRLDQRTRCFSSSNANWTSWRCFSSSEARKLFAAATIFGVAVCAIAGASDRQKMPKAIRAGAVYFHRRSIFQPAGRQVSELCYRALQSSVCDGYCSCCCLRHRLRAEGTVRRQRAAGVEADQRSADFARRQVGRVHGADRRRGGQQEAAADLDRAAEGRRAAADHAAMAKPTSARAGRPIRSASLTFPTAAARRRSG